MNTELRLSLKNNPNEVIRVMGQVETMLTSESLQDRVIYQVNLVLEEILTNIIKYAYEDNEIHEILVRLRLEPDLIRIRFEDDGGEFDPRQAPDPDLECSLEDTRVGGLGLHLVRASAELMEYRRVGSRNCLTVCLNRNN